MDSSRRIGIVGSRRRKSLSDRKQVFQLVRWLKGRYGEGLVLVSGACPEGADHFAKEASDLFQVKIDEYPIDKTNIKGKWEFTKRAYERNRTIADRSEAVFCWVHSSRTGGTENTIQHALELKKKVFLVEESGWVYLYQDGQLPTCEPVVHLPDLSFTD
jgi:predicted Rossmann fold nucleotide-binding protein DprA/Smf involved in DNA uptake